MLASTLCDIRSDSTNTKKYRLSPYLFCSLAPGKNSYWTMDSPWIDSLRLDVENKQTLNLHRWLVYFIMNEWLPRPFKLTDSTATNLTDSSCQGDQRAQKGPLTGSWGRCRWPRRSHRRRTGSEAAQGCTETVQIKQSVVTAPRTFERGAVTTTYTIVWI